MGVFSDLKPVNQAPRNAFDLSRYITFSSKNGVIKPVFQQLTLPSSEYDVDMQQLARTQPLNTAAFTGFSLNYDFVWIPLNHLYTGFNQWIGQRNEPNFVGSPNASSPLPSFKMKTFLQGTLALAVYEYFMSLQWSVTEYESMIASGQSPFPYVTCYTGQSRMSAVLSCYDALDMFEYGNFLPYIKTFAGEFQIKYQQYVKNLKTPTFDLDSLASFYNDVTGLSIDTVSSFSNFIDVISSWFESTIHFGNVLNGLLSSYGEKQFTLWPFLAYNKAFYEYYRNTYYDTSFELYHVDSLSGGTLSFDVEHTDYVYLFNANDITILSELYRMISIMCLKPHLYKRDLFTAILPSQQFGDVSVASSSSIFAKIIGNAATSANLDKNQLFASDIDLVAGYNKQLGFTTSAMSGASVSSDKFKFDPAPMISVLELRRADAMQRFKERMLRAGDKIKDIFKAHGWSEPMSEANFEPIFLGSYDGRIDINTVAATSESGDFNVGQLAANGVGVVNGNRVHFKSNDFGILICLFHISKDSVYNSFGCSKLNFLLDPFDYPYPELQNISLAPVEYGQLYPWSSDLKFSDVYGYLPRDMHFKTAVDKAHGDFFTDNPNTVIRNVEGKPTDFTLQGTFSDWVSMRENIHSELGTLRFFYIQPDSADSVFVVAADNLPSSDQFLMNCHFDIKAVEPLSVIGLPI